MEISIYLSDKPDETGRRWVLQWQAETMQGPAFWYYHTKQQAQEAESRLKYHRHDQIY